jgi:ribosomal protein uS17
MADEEKNEQTENEQTENEQVEETAEQTVSAPEGPVAPAAETEAPAADEPTADEPTAAEPPAEEQPAAEEPAAEEQPAAEEPAADEPAAEEPVAEEAAEEAPVADAEPAADVEAEAAAAEAPEAEAPAESVDKTPGAASAGKKKKPKRLPRSERHRHSKPKRERLAERKPITRLPKPEQPRGRTQERRGVVVSSAMDKTIVVRVDAVKAHPRYKKVVRRSTRFHAHDEQNQAKIGDVVRIVETRPLSKTKNWRLAEIVEVAQ